MYQLHHHSFHVCLNKKQNASLQSTGAVKKKESEASGQSLDHVFSFETETKALYILLD